MDFKIKLKAECEKIGIELDNVALERFETYYRLLLEWNQKMNLTAITEENEVIVKHFCDSLSLLRFVEIQDGAKVIDVGTGAGFPGIPLLIARTDISLTLLDSLRKRLNFLEVVLGELSLKAEIIHSRAEEGAQNAKLREKFDLVTSRAVAAQQTLSELCLGYAKVGGVFAALKGPSGESEMREAENCVRLMGGKLRCIHSYEIQDGSARSIICIDKIAKTPQKYPRHNSKIKSSPLM